MNLSYNFNDEAGDPKKKGSRAASETEQTVAPERNGLAKTLCFVWPDGKERFFNYAYLVMGEFSPELGMIVLTYTTHIATLTGRNLKALFKEISAHGIHEIAVTEKRYAAIEEAASVVTDISVISNPPTPP